MTPGTEVRYIYGGGMPLLCVVHRLMEYDGKKFVVLLPKDLPIKSEIWVPMDQVDSSIERIE